MDNYKLVCMAAAGFIGALVVTGIAQPAFGQQRQGDVVVEGRALDPVTYRRVSYADLNLANRPDQTRLRLRINDAANELCGPALGYDIQDGLQENCVFKAVYGTHPLVYKAIKQAKLRMAGYPVGPAIAISIAVNAK